MEISQNFAAFSEYMNFMTSLKDLSLLQAYGKIQCPETNIFIADENEVKKMMFSIRQPSQCSYALNLDRALHKKMLRIVQSFETFTEKEIEVIPN